MARRRKRHPPRCTDQRRRGGLRGLGTLHAAAEAALRKIEKAADTGSCLDAFEIALTAAAHFGQMTGPEDLARLRRIHKRFRVGCALR
jgi:hypothetical protein